MVVVKVKDGYYGEQLKDKILMIVIGGVIAWAGASLLKINALEVTAENNRQSIEAFIGIHLGK